MNLVKAYDEQLEIAHKKLNHLDYMQRIADKKVLYLEDQVLHEEIPSETQLPTRRTTKSINPDAKMSYQELGEIIMDILSVNEKMSSKELAIYLKENFEYENTHLTDIMNHLIKNDIIKVKKELIKRVVYYSLT